jgi:hypothetical protein
VVELLPSKSELLSSNPSAAKKKKKSSLSYIYWDTSHQDSLFCQPRLGGSQVLMASCGMSREAGQSSQPVKSHPFSQKCSRLQRDATCHAPPMVQCPPAKHCGALHAGWLRQLPALCLASGRVLPVNLCLRTSVVT